MTMPLVAAPWASLTADEVVTLRGTDAALERALVGLEAAAAASHDLVGVNDSVEAAGRVSSIVRIVLTAFLSAARHDNQTHPLESRELAFRPDLPWAGLFKSFVEDPEDDLRIVRDGVLPLAVLVWARCGHTERLLASPSARIRTLAILSLSPV